MTVVVSDVHGAYRALLGVAANASRVLVLGDLANLVDYRTNEGVLADIVGLDVVGSLVELRMHDPAAARAAWARVAATLDVDLRSAIRDGLIATYREMERVMGRAESTELLVIHGNVDDPVLLQQHLPAPMHWVQGRVLDIDGERFGFVGGGVTRAGTPGEVDDDTMAQMLAGLGPVDVLCTHVPPAIEVLSSDVIGGPGKGSRPVLDYLERHRPRLHYFGDVHQPRAVRLRHGPTTCVNVGYFRATHRGVVHRPPD